MAHIKTSPSPIWADYEEMSLDAPKSIVWASTGGDGSGKSAFGLTAPEPIFVCAFDPYGMNRVGRQFKIREDGTPKDIKIGRYPFNPQLFTTAKERSTAAQEVWDTFVEQYRTALRNARTVLWDREDIAYELLRYSSFGEQNAAPKDYGELYIEYVSLIQEAFAAGVNLGLLRGLREKWISKFDATKQKMVGHNTGEMIPDGMKKVPDHVDITLFHFWDPTEKTFMTRIDKFTEKDFRGMDVPDLTFPTMATAAYPETETEMWQ